MKFLKTKLNLALGLVIISSGVIAQDPTAYFKSFDSKTYTLKSKGVRDLVVDIENPKLTKELNEQGAFGQIKELIFRVHWTSSPERMAVEVIGMPDGFLEVKESLKARSIVAIETLFPQGVSDKFASLKITQGPGKREFTATDSSNLAPIQSYTIKFDEQDRLVEVAGNKVFGTYSVNPVYTKESFGDGKWVLTSQTSEDSDGANSMTSSRSISYGKAQGLAVPSELEIAIEQKNQASKNNNKFKENFVFKNYRINDGSAVKYFLGESKANQIVE